MDDEDFDDATFAVASRVTGAATGTAPVPEGGEALTPSGPGAVVNYYFPIRVEVVGTLPDDEVHRVAGYVFDELDRELATRA